MVTKGQQTYGTVCEVMSRRGVDGKVAAGFGNVRWSCHGATDAGQWPALSAVTARDRTLSQLAAMLRTTDRLAVGSRCRRSRLAWRCLARIGVAVLVMFVRLKLRSRCGKLCPERSVLDLLRMDHDGHVPL